MFDMSYSGSVTLGTVTLCEWVVTLSTPMNIVGVLYIYSWGTNCPLACHLLYVGAEQFPLLQTFTIQYNTWLVQCPAYNENGTARHYKVNK